MADDAKLVKMGSYADDNFVRVHAMELTSKTLNAWFYDQQPSTICKLVEILLILVLIKLNRFSVLTVMLYISNYLTII